MTIVDGIAKGHFLRRVAADKLSDMVLVSSRVKLVWSGCGGGPAFFYVGQCPDPNCRRVEVVGSRVKLVWSGCGGGPAFFMPGAPAGKLSQSGGSRQSSRTRVARQCRVTIRA